MKPSAALLFFLALAAPAADQPSATLQDFEGAFAADKYPGDAPGEVVVTGDWKASGERSLRLDPGLSCSIEDLARHDWSGFDTLRLHVRYAGDDNGQLGLEIDDPDARANYWNRHINTIGLKPGEQVVDIDYSGGLYRGEPTSHWRGPVKTPIDTGKISRIVVGNAGAKPVYVDRIELVVAERVATPGGWAFDFGGPLSSLMLNYRKVVPDSLYDAAAGFGFVGGPGWTIHKEMTWPTMLLGDAVAFPDGGFRVDLDGGDYLGWIAFERGGYWDESESSMYEHATLKVNGVVAHEHDFSPAGMHFAFQDVEVTDLAQVAERIVWPANAISRFRFAAAKGANVLTTELRGSTRRPLRVAGLILAPATDAGRAYVDRLEQLQRKAIEDTFAATDRSRREGRAAPARPLVVEVLPPGAAVYPRDWPSAAPVTAIPEQRAVGGQTVCIHLALHAQRDATATVAATPLAAAGAAIPARVAHGRYMPDREMVGSMWLAINHYRPEPTCTVGPELTRSVIVEFAIPRDAKAGTYASTITVSGVGAPITLPLKVRVAHVPLADIPMPVGLFCNAIPIEPDCVDDATWWRLQESVLREQLAAGLNSLTGGPGVGYQFKDGHIVGGRGLRYVELAKSIATIRSITNYGGFYAYEFGGDDESTRRNLAALKELEDGKGFPPHFINCFDEPATDQALNEVTPGVARLTALGARTTGYTSVHDNPLWVKLVESTFAPACNAHHADWFANAKALGRHPWVYNQGAARWNAGLHLWRQITLGCEGRLDWIGFNTQGFAFDNLDGREPANANFAVHSRFGVMTTPTWLSRREGLLDCRLRLTLEQLAKPGDPALALWSTDGYQTDAERWTPAEQDRVRAATIDRLAELTAGK